MGCHFVDGFNTDRFWAKRILLIIKNAFCQVAYDGVSYQFRKFTVPMIVQVLKQKTGHLKVGVTVSQSILACPEKIKGVKLVQSKRKLVRSHPKFIILQCFQLNPLPVHNFKLISVVPFWVLLVLRFSAPTTDFLSEIYHCPLLLWTESRSMFLSIHQFWVNLF